MCSSDLVRAAGVGNVIQYVGQLVNIFLLDSKYDFVRLIMPDASRKEGKEGRKEGKKSRKEGSQGRKEGSQGRKSRKE